MREKPYTEADIQAAIEDIHTMSGSSTFSMRAIAKDYQIPPTTLHRHLSNPFLKATGRPPPLPARAEEQICKVISYCGQFGWPMGKEQLYDLVQNYVKDQGLQTPFKNGRPGRTWYRGFLRRHPEITVRDPEGVSKNRAEGLDPIIIGEFFDMVEKFGKERGWLNEGSRMFNADEAGMGTDPMAKQLLFRKGQRNAQILQPTECKASTTVLYCASASGKFLPPFVVYKAVHLYNSWVENGPPGTVYTTSNSGWMEIEIFEQWLREVFIPGTMDVVKPCVLFYDGHNSHLSANVVELAMENEIDLICLPPHTSSALQPLDVGVFKGMKTRWREILSDFYRQSRLNSVSKDAFPPLLAKLFTHLVEHGGWAMNAFAKCGLCPLNRSKVSESCEKVLLSTTVNSATAAHSQSPESPQRKKSCPETVTATKTPIKPSLNADMSMTPTSSAILDTVVKTLRCKPDETVKAALENSLMKRKRVQKKSGEILTKPSVLARLKEADREGMRVKGKNKAEKPVVKKEKGVVKSGKDDVIVVGRMRGGKGKAGLGNNEVQPRRSSRVKAA